jgi:hypothetical protein
VRNIDHKFIGLGILAAIVGMALGIGMGIAENFTLAPVHAHINLVGWASLVLFGLAYRAGIARIDRWATVHFWVAAAGAIVLPLGILLSITLRQPALAITGSLLTLLSMLLFGVNFLRGRAA